MATLVQCQFAPLLFVWHQQFLSKRYFQKLVYKNYKMSVNLAEVGSQKVKNVANGETVELKSLWEDQNAAIIFFRRWGCMLCRLWAKELSEIAPVLKDNNIKLIGVGVEEAGWKDFVEGKYFDGDLYYVENSETYHKLGFKRFNVFSILTSLLWKQSRDAIAKGRSMGVNGDSKGNWGQTGGALLVGKGGDLIHHFVQTGPGDRLPNLDILKLFGVEMDSKNEPTTMEIENPQERQCTTEAKP